MIKKINLQRLHNAEFLAYLTDSLGFITANAVVAAAVATQRNIFNAILQQLNLMYINDPASPLTDDLLALDMQRDDYLTGLIQICEAHTHHPNTDVREAARTCARSIAIYGDNIVRQGYNAESINIANIITDWNTKTELIDGATLINAGDFVSALSTANNQFKTLYNTRTTQTAAENVATPDTMKDKRQEATTEWKVLMKKVEAHYELSDGNADWTQVVSQLNAKIDEYNEIMAVRAGRAAANSGDNPPPQEFPGS